MIKHFPEHITPREPQIKALDFIDKSIAEGKRFIILEAPTGSGKSPIAVTLANWSQDAFILTPAVGLQKQYQDDFPHLRLAKGRAHYPCTYEDPKVNKVVIHKITTGESIPKPNLENSCAKGTCMNKTSGRKAKIIEECEKSGPCPYNVMIDEALSSKAVVFNYHAFFYQAYMVGKFEKRKVMVIDEAHNLEDFLRGILSNKFVIPRKVIQSDIATFKTLTQWIQWLKFAENVNLFHTRDRREAYLAKIEQLEKAGDKVFGREPIVTISHIRNATVIDFTAINIAGSAHEFLFNFADIIVFMSGTIYDTTMFTKPLGIRPEEVVMKRLPSDFPANNRPVVLPRTGLDLSHKNWGANFSNLIKELTTILNHHEGEKGVILTSSYKMTEEIIGALSNPRLVTHNKDNLPFVLSEFYKSNKDDILVSCVVNEGVDFKDDRARFNIIIRPAYPTTEDPYIKQQLGYNQWNYYYYKTLVTFGQQVGRCVRSKDDYATTYLMDVRFKSFLNKCDKWMVNWFTKSFVK
jgi:ATP-dependent DNA helicase DinG